MVSGLFRIGALLAAGLLCGGAWAQDAEADPYGDPIVAPRAAPPQWKPLKIDPPGHRYAFPLYSSKNLERDDLRGIRRLVIVLHGVKRNAASIHGTVTALFAANPERAEDTLVIAPKFASAIDAGFAAMPAWRRASWEDGELSMQARGRPAPVSSLQVLDDLLHELSDSSRLPALRTIVLAGHSGGAQLVQRYAVLNSLDETLRREGLTLQYVVANPSSYLYLSPERPRADGKGHALTSAASAPPTTNTSTAWITCPPMRAAWTRPACRRAMPSGTSPICWDRPTTTPSISCWTRAAAPRRKAPRGWRGGWGIGATKPACWRRACPGRWRGTTTPRKWWMPAMTPRRCSAPAAVRARCWAIAARRCPTVRPACPPGAEARPRGPGCPPRQARLAPVNSVEGGGLGGRALPAAPRWPPAQAPAPRKAGSSPAPSRRR